MKMRSSGNPIFGHIRFGDLRKLLAEDIHLLSDILVRINPKDKTLLSECHIVIRGLFFPEWAARAHFPYIRTKHASQTHVSASLAMITDADTSRRHTIV